MYGEITDIQRFSLNDGDGIRTTVFFKGCNMACIWCHNPETISHKKNLMFYPEKCIGCGRCFDVCPVGVHSLKDGVHNIDYKSCTACGKCTEACYAEALRFSSRTVSLSDIEREIVQDIPYYNLSGGGVTVSGGEVFCQSEFCEGIVDLCKKHGIKVAVETNMHHPFDKIEGILKKLDFVMLDIKLMDGEAHRKYTGVDNSLILENIKKLDKLGIPMIIRTPLIPGITDGLDNLTAIADFIKELKNVRRYELLNFNMLGGAKYEAMGLDNQLKDARPLNEESLDKIREALSGINLKIS